MLEKEPLDTLYCPRDPDELTLLGAEDGKVFRRSVRSGRIYSIRDRIPPLASTGRYAGLESIHLLGF